MSMGGRVPNPGRIHILKRKRHGGRWSQMINSNHPTFVMCFRGNQLLIFRGVNTLPLLSLRIMVQWSMGPKLLSLAKVYDFHGDVSKSIYHKKPTMHVGEYTSPMDPMGIYYIHIYIIHIYMSDPPKATAAFVRTFWHHFDNIYVEIVILNAWHCWS